MRIIYHAVLKAGIRKDQSTELNRRIQLSNQILLVLGIVALLSVFAFLTKTEAVFINLVSLTLVLLLWVFNRIRWHLLSRILMSMLGVWLCIFSALAATPEGHLIPGSYYALCFSLLWLPFLLMTMDEKWWSRACVLVNALSIIAMPYLVGKIPNSTPYEEASSIPVQTITVFLALLIFLGLVYLNENRKN